LIGNDGGSKDKSTAFGNNERQPNPDRLPEGGFVHGNEQLDEAQIAEWVKQASELPGERM
jgi:hypothetical protein